MSLVASKHADEIRELWQSKALRASSGKLRKVLITALAKEYPGALVTLMKVTFPGFVDIDLPMPLGYASIEIDGSITCEMMFKDNVKGLARLYENENAFIYDMRKLADEMKLDDKDRIEMFTILQKWVSSDKRVGVFGQKLSS